MPNPLPLASEANDIAATPIRRDDRRTAILGCALEVFAERGYHNASMDEIATRAGVSKPILYQFFPGKRELYRGLLENSVKDVVAGVVAAIDAVEENSEKLKAGIAYYFDMVDQADHSFRLIFEADFTADPDVQTFVDSLISELARLLGSYISQETGLTTAESQILAAGLSGMAQASAWRWIRLGRPIPKEKAVDGIFYLGWEGLEAFPDV